MKKNASLRDFSSASDRRLFLEKQLNMNKFSPSEIKLENISNFTFTEEQVLGRNIENLIGATQIPLGIVGPLTLRANQKTSKREIYIPLATTEGALVASASRGCKAINESGGALVKVELVGTTRGPVFKVRGLEHGHKAIEWITSHIPQLSQAAQKTSSHLKLLKIDCSMVGRNLFCRFYFDTQDAMGMNMVTIATTEAAHLIEVKTKAELISVAGNFDIDKKPAWLNFVNGRGRKVWAEVILKKSVVKQVLKTTPEKIAEVVYRKVLIGSAMSGSLGFNAHYANCIAAIFAATGQDLGHVVEGSMGITTAEIVKNGDLYFSIYLPSLMIGTVGGGTHLPTQQEALSIMGVKNSSQMAEVLGSAVLALEISLIASQAQGTLARSHVKLGRKGGRNSLQPTVNSFQIF